MEKVSFEDAGLVTPKDNLDLDAEYYVYKPGFYTEKELSEEGVVALTVLLKHTEKNELFVVHGEFVSGSGMEPWGMSTLTFLVTHAQKFLGLDEYGDPDFEWVGMEKKTTLTVSDHNVLQSVTSLSSDFHKSQQQVNEFLKSVFKKEK